MTYPIDSLKTELRAVVSSFGEQVIARRPDIRMSVEQFPNIHYASTTVLDFLWDRTYDDLACATTILDTRGLTPTWMIDITTGEGAVIAELVVSTQLAEQMATNPVLAARTVATFLDEHLDDVLGTLPARDIAEH